MTTEPKWNRYPVWFVWVKKNRPNGNLENTDLRSVCTNEALAELHRDIIIRDEPDALAVWVERRETDHLYGQRDVCLAFRIAHGMTGLWERES